MPETKGMKKFFGISVLILLLAAFPIYLGCATTDQSSVIQKELAAHEKIREAVVITLGDSCAVGIRTRDIFRNSDAEKLTEEIRANLKQRYGFRNVYVFKGVRELYFMKKIRARLDSGEDPMKIYEELRSIFRKGQDA